MRGLMFFSEMVVSGKMATMHLFSSCFIIPQWVPYALISNCAAFVSSVTDCCLQYVTIQSMIFLGFPFFKWGSLFSVDVWLDGFVDAISFVYFFCDNDDWQFK